MGAVASTKGPTQLGLYDAAAQPMAESVLQVEMVVTQIYYKSTIV